MSILEPAESVDGSVDAEARAALIAQCNLRPQDVARVIETMRALRVSFGEAAVQLKLATREDVDLISQQVSERPSKGRAGIFETAIRSSQTTALVIRQGIAKPTSELMRACAVDPLRNEKIRALQTDLMLLNDSAQRGNVFALLSPGRGEGRSRLCAELAIAFAQLGRRTLLLDADLRHPTQHLLFGADNQSGLSHTLALGDAPFLHGVEGLPELTLLTSGPTPPNPLELISNRRFERLVSQMRRQYDFVVIDTPSVVEYSDALQIATVAQRVLVVSRAEATSFGGMKDMLRRLAVTESKVLGAVINRF